VDDSIVRGNTQRAIVRMLREAGAATVHVKISSPPVQWPCFYGIDFASRAELIANGATIEEISQAIGADSLAYISEDGMIGATQQPRERLCTACFTGKYPIELPGSDKLGKNLLERTDLGGLPASSAGSAPAASGDAAAEAAIEPATATPGNPDSIPVTEDPAEKPGATGCDPGPDAEFENLLTDADRVPDLHHDAATVGADKKES
jgi:amidophosphoribosyltransferase